MLKIPLDESWHELLIKDFSKEYFIKLEQFLIEEKNRGYQILPPNLEIFEALNKTPFEKVKVVIIGQDPYHGPMQAHGLCFSVNDGISIPPSLRNIFKELKSDINFKIPKSGNLISWAQQGVLLLNSTLTVRLNEANSHSKIGWQIFTDKIISEVSSKKENIVFILWGAHAQNKLSLIDKNKHLVLQSAHPSPLSASRGFFGCKHFSKTNKYLINKNIEPINW
ncbi:MAG: uracil-DNA glycosylase [Bacteroidetes bacterium]|jgi:uracil-DNA glycosylase|nr:uracil-DNA glycosylase [Bacteroidota bacterium]